MLLSSPLPNSKNNSNHIVKLLRKRKRNRQDKNKNINNGVVINLMKKFDDVAKKIDDITNTKTVNSDNIKRNQINNTIPITTNKNNAKILHNQNQSFINITNKNLVKFHRYFCRKLGKKVKKNFTKSLLIIMIKKFLIVSMNSSN